MLWKKLVQFGKEFLLIKKKNLLQPIYLFARPYNIEITLRKGGQLARAVGTLAKLIAKEGKWATLRLPFEEVRLISKNCLAIARQVGNLGGNQKFLVRVRSKCWLSKHPLVREVVTIPMAAGKGEPKLVEKDPTTPLDYPTLRRRSRKRKKYSSSFILRHRK